MILQKSIYNVKNQLKELHSQNGISYFTYDKQGNTIKEETATGNNLFEYNTLNQQVKAITKDGNTLVSRYDTEGLRAEIEENEKLTKFIFHKDNILVEADEDYNAISRFTRGHEIVAADIADSNEELSEYELNRYYYTVDEQGSTVFITDKNRKIKNEYWYDAFGNVLGAQEQVHNRITYTGQQFDGITGQYYLRARYYNPVIGRFTQEDTYRGDGLNLYAYCGNNPIAYYDPSGYESLNKENNFNNNTFLTGDDYIPGNHKIVAGEYGGLNKGDLGSYKANKAAEETTRVRHYTNRKGINGIEQDGSIIAKDNNRVYVEPANKKPLSQIEAEAKYQIKKGKGRDYVEFDVPNSKLEWIKNPRYGTEELTIKGGVEELINAIFKRRK